GRKAAAADDRLRRAEGRRRRLQDGRLQRRLGRPRSGDRGSARLHERARVRSERLRRRRRSRDVGRAQQRRAASVERPRDSGPVFARLDVQDGGRVDRPRGRRDYARHARLLPGPRQFLRPQLRLLEKKKGHGTVDLRHAIEQSCDVYFYTVGLMLNERFPGAGNTLSIDKINKWAAALGLGVKSGIDLPNEAVGLVPSTE